MVSYINYQMRGKDIRAVRCCNPLTLSLGPDCQLKGRTTRLPMPPGSCADSQPVFVTHRPSFQLAGAPSSGASLPQPSLLPGLPCSLRPFFSSVTMSQGSIQLPETQSERAFSPRRVSCHLPALRGDKTPPTRQCALCCPH